VQRSWLCRYRHSSHLVCLGTIEPLVTRCLKVYRISAHFDKAMMEWKDIGKRTEICSPRFAGSLDC
jgi:hypothetical protein